MEYKGEACALIRANRERFGAYNLEVAEGRAPAALAELPAPDGVFIGGSEGELIPILEAALSPESRRPGSVSPPSRWRLWGWQWPHLPSWR